MQPLDLVIDGARLTNGATCSIGIADGRIVAIEVKLIRSPRDEDLRHLHWLRERAGDVLLDSVVITTGPEAYRRADGIAVVPAALLGP